MFCNQCGAQLKDGARFCPKCGAPVGKPAAGVAVPPQPMNAPKKRRRAPVVVAGLLCVAVAGAAVFLVLHAPKAIDEKNFPDAALRYYVAQSIDTDKDGKVSEDERNAVTSISVDGAQDLSGMGKLFPNLTGLTVTGGGLTNLDVSDCSKLESLDVSDEPVASLDVSHNEKLASLDTTGTQIGSLDVSHNSNLSQLKADDSTTVTGTEATQVQQVWIATGVSQTYGSGATTEYSVDLDDSGRVTSAGYSYPGFSMTEDYSYDSDGRLVGIKGDKYTSVTYSYNDAGQLSQYSTKYDTRNASYENGLLTKITSGSKTLSTYSYDSQGRLVKKTNGSDGVYEYTYDDAGRLASESYTYKGKTPEVTSYTYDQDGHPTTITSTGSNISAYNGTVQATYDSEGRIATVDQSDLGIHETFTYDGNGNLAKVDATYKNSSTDSWTLSYKRSFIPKGQELSSKGLYLDPLLTTTGLAMDQSCVVHVDLEADAPGVPDAALADLQVKQFMYVQ